MDIYERAKEIDMDYYDDSTGYVYKIRDYNHAIKNGMATYGIEVLGPHDEHVGFAPRGYLIWLKNVFTVLKYVRRLVGVACSVKTNVPFCVEYI